MGRKFATGLAGFVCGVVLAVGLGALAAELSDWSGTAASNNSAPPNGWPEGMNYSEVNDAARETMAVLARWHQDTNGSLVSAGTNAAYTLTPNRTISAYAQGLRFAFEVHATCAASATLNVSSVGALPLVRPDGTAVIAGDLPIGTIADVVHDGAGRWRVVGLTFDDISRDTVTALASGSVSLASTTHGLQVGQSSTSNIAFDGDSIQGRNNGANESININALGGTVTIGEQAANSDVVLLANLVTIVESGGTGALLIRNRADGAPAVTAAQSVLMQWNSSAGSAVASAGYSSSLNFELASKTHGGHLLLSAEDTATGSAQTLLEGDPDNGVTLWRHQLELNAQNGNYTLVLADGGKVVLSDGSAANQITVPPNSTTAFPIGTQIWIANDGSTSTNDTTVVQGAGVTISGSSLTVANKRSAKLIKVGTDSWMIHHG